jgi:hypothetical protein
MNKQIFSLFFRTLIIGILLNLSLQFLAEPEENLQAFFNITVSQDSAIVDK